MSVANEHLVRSSLAGMGPTLEDFQATYRAMLSDDVEWESVGGKPHLGLEDCVQHLYDSLGAAKALGRL